MTTQTGLEILVRDGVAKLRGARVGLITNPTGVDPGFRSSADLLAAHPDLDLRALFGPEHGVRGDAQAGIDVQGSIDERTGLPVYSLYGDTRAPTTAMLDGLDALVFDIQDFGVRYATYLSTMLYAQRACAEADLRFVVLDRPNPLGGRIEGATLDPDFASFVGAAALPVLHGCTLGELARMQAAEHGWPEPLVVGMRGWQRRQWFDTTGLPWIPPSPNIPTLDSLALYGGTCLLEGTNLSEGRGTTRPFEIVGAPWIDPYELRERLDARALPGIAVRPLYFTPTSGKHAAKQCGGVQLYVADRAAFRPVATGIHLLDVLRTVGPEQFRWIEGTTGFFVDLLLGGPLIRMALDTGSAAGEIVAAWTDDEQGFAKRRQPFLLYE